MAKSADDRDVNTEIELGQIFEQCSNRAWSQNLTAKWYMKLAKQGYRRAQFRLGCMYAQGTGVPKNYIKAYAWCQVSASQHSPRALFQLNEIASQIPADQIYHARKLAKQYYDTFVIPFSQ